MEKIILEKIGDKSYWPVKGTYSKLGILWSFLNTLPPSNAYFKTWLKDPLEVQISTDNCYLYKQETNVIVGYLYNNDEDNPCEIRIDNEQFYCLIIEWEKLCLAGVQKIIIWQNGNDFTISEP